MIVAVPYWGTDPRFRALLDYWVDCYIRSGTTFPFVVLTDQATPPTCYPTLRLDLGPFRHLIRPAVEMDKKGALICAALEILRGEILLCDSDAFVMKPLQQYARPLGGYFAMTPDTSKRVHQLPWSDVKFPEHCAGVMWFDEKFARCDGFYDTTHNYILAYHELASALPEEPLVEQLAWSYAHKRLGADLLAKKWGWVPGVWGENPDAIINHYHGNAKWEKLGLTTLPRA